MRKRFLSALLALCIVLTLLPLTALAEADIVDSGVFGAEGDNLTWTLDSDGTLTIDGSGDMANYTDRYHDFPAPWISQWEHINTIVIGNDVTSTPLC